MSSRVLVSKNVVLDGRLALFHERESWLAVADLHFGYELSQRAAGNLFPLWGMQTIESRLMELLDDYRPARLILLGDLVHCRAGAEKLGQLTRKLATQCELILVCGNHDRQLRDFELVEAWDSQRFYFHHGHCESHHGMKTQVIGHHHPAMVVRDGAGLRLKLPAFIQQKKCWIMPAFSPWTGGTERPEDERSRVWLCSPQRVMRMDVTADRTMA